MLSGILPGGRRRGFVLTNKKHLAWGPVADNLFHSANSLFTTKIWIILRKRSRCVLL
jgi:hypothetical protein